MSNSLDAARMPRLSDKIRAQEEQKKSPVKKAVESVKKAVKKTK